MFLAVLDPTYREYSVQTVKLLSFYRKISVRSKELLQKLPTLLLRVYL